MTRQGGVIQAQDSIISLGQKSISFPMQLQAGTYFLRVDGSAPKRSQYRLTVNIKQTRRGGIGGDGWFEDDWGSDWGGGSWDGGGGLTCSDFSSQWQAQNSLGSNPGLDGDGDSIACESLPG